ncbi:MULTISPECIES: hypothetical protein [unclassified Fibrobacter]|uniref:hypothetical protein n=1 Tax=unclassified Fibrobacter TaxID=2634177 RepID=UPI000D6C0D5A|nr:MULTISPECIES: hypothetical protein [unclassified Fibrobacter]PWJ61723.1 hypothetical protein BGX12_1255 [Fibrobacter sp. UWR4]PZW67379.1 hypothetical protein C8E88_10255 [Fibrobacter sp. UWR1]
MKFVRSLMAVSAVAAASMLVACGDDGSTSSSGADTNCSVKDGVVVVSPAAGDTYKVGDTITVVFGTDLDAGGFDIEYRVNANTKGRSLVNGSVGPEKPDGETCYEEKVVLSEESVEPSKEALIRVIPYTNPAKGANSATFTVTE